MDVNRKKTDVVVIGAGPAGAIAASLMRQYQRSVVVLEKQHFPRFSIGESLLPECMTVIERAGMLDVVQAHGFQFKNGAAFTRNFETTEFNFEEKFSVGPGTTFQVQRAEFDQLLANGAADVGAEVRYGHSVEAFSSCEQGVELSVRDERGTHYSLQAAFVLDASGFGRVLPRLLDLERPSNFPVRKSYFTHISDHISHPKYDRNKILIVIHPQHPDVWYWLIPFSNGRSSVGVVAAQHHFADFSGSEEEILKTLIAQAPDLAEILANAEFDTQVRSLGGYACNVSRLHGPGFALLGNAGEFLDPVFSSGVTIAMKSAALACPLLDRQLAGGSVDWQAEYAAPLKQGVDTFRTFVEAWYDGRFQDVIFASNQSTEIREMISSILAGYAWDTRNPYVKQSERRLNTLVELCRG